MESGLVVYKCRLPNARNAKRESGPKCRRKKIVREFCRQRGICTRCTCKPAQAGGALCIRCTAYAVNAPKSLGGQSSGNLLIEPTQAELWNEYAAGVMKRNPIHRDDN